MDSSIYCFWIYLKQSVGFKGLIIKHTSLTCAGEHRLLLPVSKSYTGSCVNDLCDVSAALFIIAVILLDFGPGGSGFIFWIGLKPRSDSPFFVMLVSGSDSPFFVKLVSGNSGKEINGEIFFPDVFCLFTYLRNFLPLRGAGVLVTGVFL